MLPHLGLCLYSPWKSCRQCIPSVYHYGDRWWRDAPHSRGIFLTQVWSVPKPPGYRFFPGSLPLHLGTVEASRSPALFSSLSTLSGQVISFSLNLQISLFSSLSLLLWMHYNQPAVWYLGTKTLPKNPLPNSGLPHLPSCLSPKPKDPSRFLSFLHNLHLIP